MESSDGRPGLECGRDSYHHEMSATVASFCFPRTTGIFIVIVIFIFIFILIFHGSGPVQKFNAALWKASTRGAKCKAQSAKPWAMAAMGKGKRLIDAIR